jgi:hypothetical protein
MLNIFYDAVLLSCMFAFTTGMVLAVAHLLM